MSDFISPRARFACKAMRDPETKALKVGQFRSKLMLLQPVFAQALVDAVDREHQHEEDVESFYSPSLNFHVEQTQE